MVKPVRCLKQWAHYQTDEPILSPIIRRHVGRPQTKRRKENDESVKATGRMSKLEVHMTCSKCDSKGHNKRSCRGQVGGNARTGRMAPRRTTRPSRSNSTSSSHPINNQHHQQGSQKTLGPTMTVRWMPSQQSIVQESQTQESMSKK
ncbi:hypothetical protein V6N11_039409 [Hibiscus sabdariffa]|uniref:CCHC-type domain-containing protein n=1 Tax=Hibiscus sabdariffa TaxID=183260 RepID=A0ABR2SNM9_9ROSI